MFPYADYEFYQTKMQGELDELTFRSEVMEASVFLRYLTMGRSDQKQPEALQYAACAIADMYAKEKKKDESGKSRKKSENTDGYSVSYVTDRQDGESLEELMARKALLIARMYLIGTGLLSRKVGCGHGHKCGYHDL